MESLCIVTCGDRKIWSKNPHLGAMPAGEVYIGGFSKLCQEYARFFYPDNWVILSAKYGFLRPEEAIEGPYNVSFNNPGTNPITLSGLILVARAKDLLDFNQYVVLGGKNYVKMTRGVFIGKCVYWPLCDCQGIGYMMQKIKLAIMNKRPI
jgi:hypothetical protein